MQRAMRMTAPHFTPGSVEHGEKAPWLEWKVLPDLRENEAAAALIDARNPPEKRPAGELE